LWADVAQLVEHSLGKGEVISSILIIGSRRLSSGSYQGIALAMPQEFENKEERL
jgi:hypothetical protein